MTTFDGGSKVGNLESKSVPEQSNEISAISVENKESEDQLNTNKFTIADYLLLAVMFFLLTFLCFFFEHSLKVVEHSLDIANTAYMTESDNNANRLNISTSDLFIKHSNKLLSTALYLNGIKRSAGFLIGSLVTMLGCMVIIRGTRVNFSGSYKKDGNSASIFTNSAGVIIVLIGALIIIYANKSMENDNLRIGNSPAMEQSLSTDVNGPFSSLP